MNIESKFSTIVTVNITSIILINKRSMTTFRWHLPPKISVYVTNYCICGSWKMAANVLSAPDELLCSLAKWKYLKFLWVLQQIYTQCNVHFNTFINTQHLIGVTVVTKVVCVEPKISMIEFAARLTSLERKCHFGEIVTGCTKCSKCHFHNFRRSQLRKIRQNVISVSVIAGLFSVWIFSNKLKWNLNQNTNF